MDITDEERELNTTIATLRTQLAAAQVELADTKEVLDDKRRLTRELDTALNGEAGAAKQAALCDLISQAKSLRTQLAAQAALAVEVIKKVRECPSIRIECSNCRGRIDDFLDKPEVKSLMKEGG